VATFEVADGITGIDTRMVGRYLVTSAYLIEAAEPALVETGPQTSTDAVTEGLSSLGVEPDDLAHVIVTHIHLDHAGGAGTIAKRYPNATVWVNSKGARHLVDPARLVASTERTYGPARMKAMFGSVEPVAAERVRSIDEGDAVNLGGRDLEVMYTPGHASHHVALRDSTTGSLFVGDALGVHLPDVKVLRPATPPPDFDLELATSSIRRIEERAEILLLSHFGPVAEVRQLCELAIQRLVHWTEDVRGAMGMGDDIERVIEVLTARGSQEYEEDSGEPVDMERYDVLSSIRMNALGIMRYWRKRAEKDESLLGEVPLELPERPPAQPS
jgi:glyoxylase-like metal-dependent hydrolase (beta-lactamase superfamily II)